MSALVGSYETRMIHCLGLSTIEGWKLKVYEIYQHKDARPPGSPEHFVVTEAKRFVRTVLKQPAETQSRYGIGFLIVHRGMDRNWMLLDWWYEREILKQVLMSSPLDRPSAISLEQGDDLMACTWELAVIGFERDAWVEKVLRNPDGPDLEAYFEQRLDAEI